MGGLPDAGGLIWPGTGTWSASGLAAAVRQDPGRYLGRVVLVRGVPQDCQSWGWGPNLYSACTDYRPGLVDRAGYEPEGRLPFDPGSGEGGPGGWAASVAGLLPGRGPVSWWHGGTYRVRLARERGYACGGTGGPCITARDERWGR